MKKTLGKKSAKKKTLNLKPSAKKLISMTQKENEGRVVHHAKNFNQFFATERINLPRGKVLLRTSYPSSAAGSLRTSPSKIVL